MLSPENDRPNQLKNQLEQPVLKETSESKSASIETAEDKEKSEKQFMRQKAQLAQE